MKYRIESVHIITNNNRSSLPSQISIIYYKKLTLAEPLDCSCLLLFVQLCTRIYFKLALS